MFLIKVGDAMTSRVVTASPETPLREVAGLLAQHSISGVPIVDDDGNLVGVVTEADFLIKEQGQEGIHHRPMAWLIGEDRSTKAKLAKISATTARDAMTTPVLTIGRDRPIREAADLMAHYQVNRLPVVGENGGLVGIISRADIVRAFVRGDAEILSVIRGEVLPDVLLIDPSALELSVADGIVRVHGTVDRRSTAEILERLIARVDGVVAVEADVAWEEDDRQVSTH